MSNTAFLFDEHCFWHSAGSHVEILPVGGWIQPPSAAGHAESPETKRRLKNLLDVSGLSQSLQVSSAPVATQEDLLRVHPQTYLERFKALSDNGGGPFGDNAPVGPGTFEIALKSAGLVCAAVEKVMRGEADNAYALSRPPGHHCLPDQAMGFCFLANIPVAIERAKAMFNLERVAVIDWDVHHGNGTQAVYYDRPDVLSISIHQEGCFPPGYSGAEDRGEGAGEGCNLNIPLLPGSGHEAYMHAFDELVAPALRQYKPQLIIVACGYDANGIDPLARMLAHSDTFRQMTEKTKALAEELCDGRLVLAHEGGYSEGYVPFCGLAAIEALSGIRTEVEDPLLDFIKLQQPKGAQPELQFSLLEEQAQSLGFKG